MISLQTPAIMPHIRLLASDARRFALHTICKHKGLSYVGLTTIDMSAGEYLSEAWHIAVGDPYDLVDGWLYFHDSSNLRSTFCARIIEVIPKISDTGRSLTTFRIRRMSYCGVGWRGSKASRSVHNGGIVPALLHHETTGQ